MNTETYFIQTKEINTLSVGKTGAVTVDALHTLLALIENDYMQIDVAEDGSDIIEDWQQETADQMASVHAFIEREIAKREKRATENAVWKVAKEKGWDKSNPNHRAHIRSVIENHNNNEGQ